VVALPATQLYATGQYSTIDVAVELNRRGYRIYNVQQGMRVLFDKWNVLVMLKNPVYRGFVKYKEQRFPGRHEPLIDADTWEQVQAMMAGHAAKRGRVSIRGTLDGGGLLTELAHCEHCGRRMHHHSSTSKKGVGLGAQRVCYNAQQPLFSARIRGLAKCGDGEPGGDRTRDPLIKSPRQGCPRHSVNVHIYLHKA
jgi:hypothetical protein